MTGLRATLRSMEQRQLGGSGLWVSHLALGTMTWGKETGPEEAAKQAAAFVDAGGTLLDTADIYADGEAERLLGEITSSVIRREDVVVATKAGHSPRGYRAHDTSRRHLLACLDASLQRLRTDHVDLWQLHVHDPLTPLEETMGALDTAVSSGRVRYVAVGRVTAGERPHLPPPPRAGAPRGAPPGRRRRGRGGAARWHS
jgi:aryl-alcohol dehydrogenase-like predicted oxidoreductase